MIDINDPKAVADWLNKINYIEGNYSTGNAADLIRKLAGLNKHSTIENVVCPDCGGDMISRKSQYGTFWGCKKYPKCKGTRDSDGLSKEEKKLEREKQEEKDPYQPVDERYKFGR